MSSTTDPRPLMVEIAHLLYSRFLTNSAGGNLSCRVGERIYLTPRGLGSRHRWQLREEMVLVFDADLNPIEGDPRMVSRESRMHFACYRRFPEVNGVIHAHPRYLGVFAAAGRPVTPTSEYTEKFGPVEVVPPLPSHSQALADAVVEKLAPHQGDMGAHGLGATVRGEREVVTPSGKGVAASLAIHELGGETVAAGLSAGHTGRLLTDLLDGMGVPHDFAPALGETRTAVVLVDLAVGEQSTIMAPTLAGTEEHLHQLLALLDRYAGRAWGVICGGSVPPGLPPDSHARLLRHARQKGLVTLLDSSGESLRQGVGGLPHVLKVNRYELEALDPGVAGGWGSGGDIAGLAGRLAGRLGEWASDALVVTLGARGALAVMPEAWYHAQPPQVPVVNTAAAASVVMNEGTGICRRAQVEELLAQVRCYRGFRNKSAVKTQPT